MTDSLIIPSPQALFQTVGSQQKLFHTQRRATTNSASKICERIALRQFVKYLKDNDLLTTHQSENKENYSTETLNLFATDHTLDTMDRKQITALVLLDLSKAFDSINHGLLLKRLRNLGASPFPWLV